MVSPAFSGFFFCFAAVVLFIFVSVSAPTWDRIYFLQASAQGMTERFGIFGYCLEGGSCSSHTFGYNLNLSALGVSTNFGNNSLHTLTKVLIIHPIAGGLALLALIWGFLGVTCASRACTILMALSAALATLAAVLALAIDLALWIIIRNRVRDAGYSADLGNAIWMTVGAVAALMLATCTAACGSCGRFATGRMGGEKY